jgi:flagellar protein FlaF
MGFSVSGAAAIIFLSLFIAFGTLYTATDNSFERVIDAQDDRTEQTLETKNTALNVTSANYNASADELTITANNTGATTLSLNETTILIDNAFQKGWETNATVDGNSETDLWLPGETLTVTISFTSQPGQVQVVTEIGVAGMAEVRA